MKQKIDLETLVDVPRLQAWLDENIPELGNGPLKAEVIHGGTSNVIISLERGGQTMVLRRPPASPPPGSTKAIEREATLLSALRGSSVPHPKVYGSCFDPSVIGGSFYVMEMVNGWAPELNVRVTSFKPPFDQMPHKRQLAYAMVDGLIALANVDYKAVGLESFGKPEGFLKRQVDRWGQQLESYKTTYKNYPGRQIPGIEFVADWLRSHIPPEAKPGILHGDYGFPNVMYANDLPVRLAAMIDWELATIGDPLMDMGWYLNAFRDERDPGAVPHSSYFDPADFPTRQELAAHYARGTGRDVSQLDYYMVLALYKGACICEYKVAAAMDGLQSQAIGEMFTQFVLDNVAEAEKIARWNT
jgi:aminoglycoside phosphotransferase (APT) family kinase protein